MHFTWSQGNKCCLSDIIYIDRSKNALFEGKEKSNMLELWLQAIKVRIKNKIAYQPYLSILYKFVHLLKWMEAIFLKLKT